MINAIQLLRNIGLFDSVSGGAGIPLARLTLVYAENGRGKTTLAAIMRSLATGDPLPIAERRRLAAQHPPHVVVDCSGGPPSAMFQNGTWNRTLPNMVIFDDQFVDQNIYSGLTVASEHRQNLHEWILGSQVVTLNQTLNQLVERIEVHNTALRIKAAAIPVNGRGTMSVDNFCALPVQADIDITIRATERSLSAAREQDPIQNTSMFAVLDLPSFDIAEIDRVLEQDLPTLDSTAAERVKVHLATLGQDGEAWVAEGMDRIPRILEDQVAPVCPFCAQGMQDSPVLNHYRAYFSQEYANLKRAVSTALTSVNRTHGGDVPTTFERAVRVTVERRQFWARFCDVPDIHLDTAAIVTEWQAARNAITTVLAAKQVAPLDRMTLTDDVRNTITAYEASRQTIIDLNQALQGTNAKIQQVKQQAATANIGTLSAFLERLRAIRARHTVATDALCVDYLNEKAAKATTEAQRDQARAALDRYRTGAFPACQRAVNLYLNRFNAGFTLDNVCSANTRGGSTCTYNVVINNTSVSVAGGTPEQGSPSFRNTLSAGDRNTLALAFFLASLDQDPGLTDKVVVIDDPISSMDEHRSLTTVQEIRRLSQRVSQVIVLSHSKSFLCSLWEGTDQTQRTALQVTRDIVGSTISEWDVNQDCITEHDRRHTLLREYMRNNTGNIREVANAIRPSLEAFMRVACPEHFPPGTMLGVFRGLCEQRIGTAQEILDAATTQELCDLVEYANRFHHDTNPAWEAVVINDGELHGFVRRSLAFTKR
jgi:wobble nucleotide-excising tRNase